jgi:hypothetical protein
MTAFVICSTILLYLVTIPLRRAVNQRWQALARRVVVQPVVFVPVHGIAPAPQAPASMLQPKQMPGYLNWSPAPVADPHRRGLEK